jgi:hypothetical protein
MPCCTGRLGSYCTTINGNTTSRGDIQDLALWFPRPENVTSEPAFIVNECRQIGFLDMGRFLVSNSLDLQKDHSIAPVATNWSAVSLIAQPSMLLLPRICQLFGRQSPIEYAVYSHSTAFSNS